MSRILRKIILVILSALLTFLFGGLAQASQHPAARKQKQTSAPQPVVPQGPLPQPTLDQMPAIPPQVTYQAGQLTIQAQNSTLGDILRAVRAKTGASVDIPSNADERVVGRLGPGPAREVLASLLNGSHFNYVMVGSATDPGAVQQVILTSKSGGTTTAAAAASPGANQPDAMMNAGSHPVGFPVPPGAQGQAEAQPQPDTPPEEMQGDNGAEAAGDENADQAEQAIEQEGAPEGLPPNGQQQQNGQPAVKTPEQLLMELQQQQQQQQLQQQQQQQGQQQLQQRQPMVFPPNQPPNRPDVQQQQQPPPQEQ